MCMWLIFAYCAHISFTACILAFSQSFFRTPPPSAPPPFVRLLFALKCIKLQTEMIDGSGCVDLCATSLLRRIFAHFFLYAHAHLQTHAHTHTYTRAYTVCMGRAEHGQWYI